MKQSKPVPSVARGAAPAENAAAKKVPFKKPARPLPPALAANARAAKELAQARLKARGEAAIERIREKLTDVAANLLDVGGNLAELDVPGVVEALGYASFDDVCQQLLGISAATARRWMAIARNLERRFVLEVGIDRARALLELAEATPADDRAEDLIEATLVLPSGEALVVKTATNERLDAAAKAFRQVRADEAGKKPRGFTTSPAERKAHAAIVKRLARAPKAALATTRLVAQREGGPKVVLEVRLAAWDETLAVLV